ncbi:hypothetical protein LOZ53_001654 [Ophidiomyces ophidiicola]|nr:hypothetical protein LOZ53_001654 [Ophidiomyces ophidiicola]
MSVASLTRDSAFQARSLFRSLLRQSKQFSNYNFREYALRRTRDAFRQHRHETEERKIQELLQKGIHDLRMMKVSQNSRIVSAQTHCSKVLVGMATFDFRWDADIFLSEANNYQPVLPVGQASRGGTRIGMVDALRGKKPGLKEESCAKKIQPQVDTFRSSRTRSQGLSESAHSRVRPGQVDHDVFEGLPVRRWSRQPAIFSQAPKAEEPDITSTSAPSIPELPMPKDSHILAPLSRALLRAARAGCTYIKPAPKDIGSGEKENKAEESATQPTVSRERAFTTVRWSAIPRNQEPPEMEFLAKRKHGLRSLYGGVLPSDSNSAAVIAQTTNEAPRRKIKFKTIDAVSGTISIYEAWVLEGYKVEGEIASEAEVTAEHPDATVVTISPTPGTIVDGVGVADQDGVIVAEPEGSMVTAIRRRNPPPKRKAKGIGRGRKKKVMFLNGDIASSQMPNGDPSVGDAPQNSAPTQGTDQGVKDAGGDEEEEEEEEEDGDGSDEESGDDSKSQKKTESPTMSVITNHQEPPSDLQPVLQQETVPEHPPRDKSSSPDLPLVQAMADRTTTVTSDKDQDPHPQETCPEEESQPIPISDTAVVAQPTLSEDQNPIPVTENPLSPPPDTAVSPIGNIEKPSLEPPDTNLPPTSSPPTPEAPGRPEETPPAADVTMTAPQTSLSSPTPQTEPIHFEDGEVDLLGSLEASLDHPTSTEAEVKETQPAQESDIAKQDSGDVNMTG